MKQYYTYLLIDSNTSQPFYVGKGTSSRMYQHKRDALNSNYFHRSVHRKIQNIIRGGGEIIYEREYHLTEDVAFKTEIKLIKQHGRKDLGLGLLCNLTDGGEGASNQNPESVERRAAKHRGMKRSAESKQHMSRVQKEMAEERRKKYGGKACSPKTSKRMSKSRKGKEWSETARNAVRLREDSKAVLVHKKDDESFVGEYKTVAECAKILNCDGTTVWKMCRGENSRPIKSGKVYPIRSHHGYTFKYKD